jgi:hypothetical protein
MKLEPGDRVYHRRADLFGTIEEMDDTHATVLYDGYESNQRPHDGTSTTRIALRDLIPACDAVLD